jgi:ribosomal protein S18 acetylase RimI-like enzyme
MSLDDYPEVLALWQASPGVGLNESDTQDAIAAFLARNPGQSLVAVAGEHIAGAVLCGHDGRRGYLHHLAVAEPHRGQGIAAALVDRCLTSLAQAGIPKCNVFLYADNETGAGFWQRHGFSPRGDLRVLHRPISSRPAGGG